MSTTTKAGKGKGSSAKTSKKASAKKTVVKETGKRLSNELLMDKLVTEGASDAKIKREFEKRYEGQTPEYIAKRIKIYRSISERRLGIEEQKEETKSSKKTSAKKTSAKGKKTSAKKTTVAKKEAVTTPEVAVNS